MSEFDIKYRPRQTIKAQALADFIAEFIAAGEEPSQEKSKRYGKFISMGRPSRGQEELEFSSRCSKDNY